MSYYDWVETIDLMPRHEYYVWMYDDDESTVFIGYFDKDNRAFCLEDQKEYYSVTHWKPVSFPPAPEES